MNYTKRLPEMNDTELETCIMSLFRAPQNGHHQRTRDQNVALIESWLHAMRLTPKHEFLFHRDESDELWLLNRDKSNCQCCKQQVPVKLRSPKQGNKVNRSASPRIEKAGPDSQVTVITIQPGKQSASGSKHPSRQTSPNLHRRQIPNRPEKKSRNCCKDCCAECSSILSNLFS
ncbi:hypothetical protein M3Y97_00883600 [Aphelenchoides bicaudatus]|nr:hypothetical protein M3Y97_00883600 [Aphelenchoides bicaudatus]